MLNSRAMFLAILGFSIVVIAIIALNNQPVSPEVQAQRDATATAQARQRLLANTVKIVVSYGTEKRRWLEDATKRFEEKYPNIDVELIGEGSMEAYRALSQVKDDSTTYWRNRPLPILWSPGGRIQVAMLNADQGREFATQCKDLVLSPLAFIMWEDRAKVLETYYKDRGGITFDNLEDALSEPKGGRWGELGGDPNWGLLKIGYTNPNESNGGFMFLMALIHAYLDRTAAATVAELTDPKFAEYARRIARAISIEPLNSSGILMDKMMREGPATYDMVILHEALAIENHKIALNRHGIPLRIAYPKYNLYSEHPMCLIDHPSFTAQQREAAKLYQSFLLSREIQELARVYGYRPADTDVPVFVDGSPFNDPAIRAMGVSNYVGQTLAQPDGNTLKQILTIWNRAVN
ncbi:MAG: substrate-binding domain-containing protein [Anaerolineae bacterium]|nr:substrate-binding domain-containing protein [Anaerolineae bacterium]